MTTTWILTANASEAHLYSATRAKLLNGEGDLTLVEEFFHPESRLKTSELIEGRPGKYHNAKTGYGTFSEPTDAKKVESELFAKELAGKLQLSCKQHCFEDLILVATPGFHGLLNKFIKNSPVEQVVSLNIEKDYTRMKPTQLAKLIVEHF